MKIMDKIRNFGKYFVSILSFLMVSVILVLNIFYTSFTYNNDYPLIAQNTLLTSLLKLGLGIIIVVIIYIFTQSLPRRLSVWMIIIVNLLLLILKFYVVYSFNNYPTIDPYQIFRGVLTLQFTNDIRPLYIGNYFATFPQQLGIVSVLRPLSIFFKDNINLYYYFQALLSQLTVVIFTLTAYRLKGTKVAFFSTVLLNLFIPYLFIAFLFYGDLYAIFFISVAFLLLSYIKPEKSKQRCIIMGIIYLLLSIAYLARLTTNVVILAMIFTLFIVRSMNFKTIILMIILLSILVIPMRGLLSLYNLQDVQLGKYAHPNSTWIRIGLGYGGGNAQFAGVHNGNTDLDFEILAYDPTKMDLYNQDVIKTEVLALVKNNQWIEFFKEKMNIMWTDPDFAISTLILPMKTGKIKQPWKLIQTENYGFGSFELSTNTRFGDWLQENYFKNRSIEKVYYFGLLSSLLLILSRRKSNDWPLWFLRISLIGYVLLHLLLEVKSRYVIGYMSILIFIVSLYFGETLESIYQWIKLRILKQGETIL